MALSTPTPGTRHKRGEMEHKGSGTTLPTKLTCPHCGHEQVIQGLTLNANSARLSIFQCLGCSDFAITAAFDSFQPGQGRHIGPAIPIWPKGKQPRSPLEFAFVPADVSKAYSEACDLLSVHAGAAGGFARRALELLLDAAGYESKTILDAIKAVHAEPDADKRLPKRLRDRLDYIKEVGNFAVHIRRDDQMIILNITEDEASAAIDTIEALIGWIFEEPGQHYHEAVAMNEKLRAAGKPEIPLPSKPIGT